MPNSLAGESHRGHHARALDAVGRVRHRLARAHREAQKEVMILGQRLDGLLDPGAVGFRVGQQVGHQLAGEDQRCGRAPAVHFVTHMHRALHDGLERNTARAAHHLGEDRRDGVLDIEQPVAHAVVIDAVVQPPGVGALVEIAVARVAESPVLDHENRHRGGVDAGQRADAAVIVTAANHNLAGFELGDGLLAGSRQPFEQGTADHRGGLAAGVFLPRQHRARGQDDVLGHAGQHVDRRADVAQDRVGPVEPAEGFGVGGVSVDRAHGDLSPPLSRSFFWACAGAL